jgi:Phosphatidylserine/phosphatidylglycerophosphate/cardiolipin synthases and related enzymes
MEVPDTLRRMNHHRPPAFSTRQFAEQALSRSAGAPLISGNAVELLIDAQAHYDAWLNAIAGARRHVFLENYIIRNDRIGQAFRDALVERARAGVFVAVIADWAGCLGQSRSSFWNPLREAGGEVRIYNPPRLGSSFGWISRDHRKVLVVDGEVGFLSGVCISEKWLGDPGRDVPPWRDTGVMLRGPAVAEIEQAFTDSWRDAGPAGLPEDPRITRHEPVAAAGDVNLRVIATQPSTAGMYRLDQMVAAMATKTLWLTDAYFVGVAPYVQALSAAARDGVDVRLLVPGTSDIPMVAGMSRSGYRPLLKAGIRVFEWNGSMLHAKTAVADNRWARVGSSNLNIASWLSNREIDVAIEDAGFAAKLAAQYEADLENATEIRLRDSRRRSGNERLRSGTPRPPRPRHGGGSSSRAAAGALRIANTVGAAITHHRVLGDTESGPVLAGALTAIVLTLIAVLWPAIIAWPLALIGAWFAVNLSINWFALRRRRKENTP